MCHSWLTITVGDQVPEGAIPTSDDATVFIGRAQALDSDDWDYQIAEIWIDHESKKVKRIMTALWSSCFTDCEVAAIRNGVIRFRSEILVSHNVEWQPAKRGDQIPQRAIQFMKNGGDGPCVVARCIGNGSLRPCKLNTEHDALPGNAWNFRYTTGDRTTAVQEGDILVDVPFTVVIVCECIASNDGPGSIKCTKLSGEATGIFDIPKGKEVYGAWLPEQVSAAQEGDLRLIKLNGDMISREA